MKILTIRIHLYKSMSLMELLFRKPRNAILGITEQNEAVALEKYQMRARK